MGNWKLVIEGHGTHHNKGVPTDANILAGQFVDKLRASGQEVSAATFELEVGRPADDLTPGSVAYMRYMGAAPAPELSWLAPSEPEG